MSSSHQLTSTRDQVTRCLRLKFQPFPGIKTKSLKYLRMRD